MITEDDRKAIVAAADACGLEAAAVLAVVEVESAGRVSAMVAGRAEPLIRWEGHYFDRLCNPAVRAVARARGLSAPQAGAIANPPDQEGRWAILAAAAALDRAAAYQSCSWGVGQVMGSHWQMLGFESVEALVAEARSGLAGQVRLMLGYIEKTGLSAALAAHDWPAFAKGYNGPNYAAFGYDVKLATAYDRAAAILRGEPVAPAPLPVLRRGDHGAAVADLQAALVRAGHALVADGIFGPATDAAVRAVQAGAGLPADGLVGPMTRRALEAAALPSPAAEGAAGSAEPTVEPAAGLVRLVHWIVSLFRRQPGG